MTSPRADKLLLISIASSLRSSFSTWQFPSRPIGDRTRDGWVKMINIFKPCSNMFKVAVSLSSSIMQYSASVAGNCWHGHMWSQFLGEIYRLSDEKVWWPPPPNNPNTPTSASSPWSPVSSDLCLLQPFAAAKIAEVPQSCQSLESRKQCDRHTAWDRTGPSKIQQVHMLYK
jgi:hypothetical protein